MAPETDSGSVAICDVTSRPDVASSSKGFDLRPLPCRDFHALHTGGGSRPSRTSAFETNPSERSGTVAACATPGTDNDSADPASAVLGLDEPVRSRCRSGDARTHLPKVSNSSGGIGTCKPIWHHPRLDHQDVAELLSLCSLLR